MLRTQDLVIPPEVTVKDEIRRLMQSVAYALRSTVSTVSKYAPGHIIYERDMIVHQETLVRFGNVK